MASANRTAVIGTRTSSETRARFAALAARRGLTESALLALLIEQVVVDNSEQDVGATLSPIADEGCAIDRLTLRLRPGDRALVDARAASRRMKTASYLSMLVRAHVRGTPVMPPQELGELRCAAGLLGSMGRQLRAMASRSPEQSVCSADYAELLVDVGRAVESVRAAVADVVRANLKSWEAGHA